MTRSTLAAGILCLILAASPAAADDPLWSSELQASLESAGGALSQAETTEHRLAALRSALDSLEAHQSEPGALLMRHTIASQYAAEHALHLSEAVLEEAASSAAPDASLAERHVADLMTSIAVIAEVGGVPPSTALRIADAIDRFDATIGAATGRSLDDVLRARIEDPDLRQRVQTAFGEIRRQADEFRDSDELAAADEEARSDYARALLDRIPSQAGPAFGSPAPIVFGEELAWKEDMWRTSTDGLQIVADGIETGRVDTRRLQEVTDRLNQLRRGPWGSHTARGVMRQWCNRLTAASAECQRIANSLLAFVSGEDGSSGWTSSDGDDSIEIEGDDLTIRDLSDDWLTVTAPSQYHGDWSGMSVIMLDVMGPPKDIDNSLLLALESGQNSALFEFSVVAVVGGEWRTLIAPLEPERWVVNGDWPELIRNITDFKIRIDLHNGQADDVARLRAVGPVR